MLNVVLNVDTFFSSPSFWYILREKAAGDVAIVDTRRRNATFDKRKKTVREVLLMLPQRISWGQGAFSTEL